MHKVYIGIDNGVSGTIGFVKDGESSMIKTPVFSEQSYTKKKANINRVDTRRLREFIVAAVGDVPVQDIMVVIERPMINNTRFAASISAARSLEATLIVVEQLGLPHMYTDSRPWQSAMLPSGCHGKELKDASHDIGIRLFPHLEQIIHKHGDADGLLIAEWSRRKGL